MMNSQLLRDYSMSEFSNDDEWTTFDKIRNFKQKEKNIF